MRLTLTLLSLLALAVPAKAADPVYLDQLIETPLNALQAQFPNLKKEGCYRTGEGRYHAEQEHHPAAVRDAPDLRMGRAAESHTGDELPGPLVEVPGRFGVRLGHQSHPPGRPDLRHVVQL